MRSRKGRATIFIVVILIAVALGGAYQLAKNQNSGTQVVLETNKGEIVIQLYGDMPITAGNFEKLVSEGYYDGVKFHRIVSGFMLQGGDPLTKDDSQENRWGTGGPGYTIDDEKIGDYSNKRGTISMANAGPGTGGSQFFINLGDNIFLDSKHPVFGEVIEGMDVVDAIANVEVRVNGGEKSRPVEPVVIESARVK